MIANATRSILILLLLNIISIGAPKVEPILDEKEKKLLQKNFVDYTKGKVTILDEDKCKAIKVNENMYLHVHKKADKFVVEKKVFPFELVGFLEGDNWWSPNCEADTDEIKFIVTFRGLPHITRIEIMKKGKTVQLTVPQFEIEGGFRHEVAQATFKAGDVPVFVRFDGFFNVKYMKGKFEKKPNAVTCESPDCNRFIIEPALKDMVDNATTYLISHETGNHKDFYKEKRCPVAEPTVYPTKCSYKRYGTVEKDLTAGQTALIAFACGIYNEKIELKCVNSEGKTKLIFRRTKAAAPAPGSPKLPAATEGPQEVEDPSELYANVIRKDKRPSPQEVQDPIPPEVEDPTPPVVLRPPKLHAATKVARSRPLGVQVSRPLGVRVSRPLGVQVSHEVEQTAAGTTKIPAAAQVLRADAGRRKTI